MQLDGGAPEVEVGMGEIDGPVQDCPRVVEQGWLKIGLEILGESSPFFLLCWLYTNMGSFRLDCHPYGPSHLVGSRLDDPSLRPKGPRQCW